MRASRLFLCLLLLCPAFAFAEEPARAGGETIDVDMKVIPFYAVDAQGRPVFDLRAEEVEVLVDGAPVAVDAFDAMAQAGAAGAPAVASQPAPAKARRHVILLFDVAFSSIQGVRNGQALARQLLKDLPESDVLYLVTNDLRTGFEQKVGPVPASAKGRQQVLAQIEGLRGRSYRQFSHNPTADLGFNSAGASASGSGRGKNGQPKSQMTGIWDGLNLNENSEYLELGRDLGEAMGRLATDLRRINEPKLLVFLSQGLKKDLYFEGSRYGLQVSTEAVKQDAWQADGLVKIFTDSMQALADSGTMALFVNLDDRTQGATLQDNPLRHMASTSGGLYLEGNDPKVVEARVTGSTAAYYEAGFYLGQQAGEVKRARVEVRSRRPGVELWAPASLKTRETWRGLDEHARKALIVDLVEGGVEAQRARGPVRLDVRELSGNVLGQAVNGERRLRYQAVWPKEATEAASRLEVYNVLLVPTAQAGNPEILQFEANPANLEIAMPGKPQFIWGIVAVEPRTGKAWFRRLLLQGEKSR